QVRKSLSPRRETAPITGAGSGAWSIARLFHPIRPHCSGDGFLMGRRPSTGRAGNDNPARIELGPFWLWYRAERDDWCICWYDDGGPGRSRRTCRKATGIRGGEAGRPPAEAQAALADHFAAWRKPVEQAPTEALVEGLLADWLQLHVEKGNADTERPKY